MPTYRDTAEYEALLRRLEIIRRMALEISGGRAVVDMVYLLMCDIEGEHRRWAFSTISTMKT